MVPAPGDRLRRFVGDVVRFRVQARADGLRPAAWSGRLRTNLGRAEVLRQEILEAHAQGASPAGKSWHDIVMRENDGGWEVELPLAEPGFFRAKAYLLDERGWQHWPVGADVGISVHPNPYRTANVIYCAFTRLFGPSRTAAFTKDEKLTRSLRPLEDAGYAIIPPSGKLRDVTRQMDHIFNTLGCRILHLLPVNPTPTIYARFGRFGSPYAVLDLRAVDPALVELDKRTTGVDQFCELTHAAHLRGGRVFLDMVINHTGWGSVLQDTHPEWFLRRSDGQFVNPGAWGVTWEDLIELKHDNVALWDELAEALLVWCRRGVDGFRCDAGYMVPVPAWQYIIARVHQEYPETLFLLEGLGGAWEATEALLTEGGMQWAYSELFQNYSGPQVAGYVDHLIRQSDRVGLLVNYSETHDNDRLAAKGRVWSLLRNRLCALTSVSGGFGFTCGVEWLASEKIRVHESSGLAWGSQDNLLPELAALNRLIADHPCFFDNASICRISSPESAVQAWLRRSGDARDQVLVLVNLDPARPGELMIDKGRIPERTAGGPSDLSSWVDLLGQSPPAIKAVEGTRWHISLLPGAAYCLAPRPAPLGQSGPEYRRARAQAAWGLQALNRLLPTEQIGAFDWQRLAQLVDRAPAALLDGIAALAEVSQETAAVNRPQGILERLQDSMAREQYSRVILWEAIDCKRVTLVPPGHWLLLKDSARFRATLQLPDGSVQNVESIGVREGEVAWFLPPSVKGEAHLRVQRWKDGARPLEARLQLLSAVPDLIQGKPRPDDLVLLTNGRGGMARLRVDLGRILSKYDCVLGANLHPTLPVDRHVLVKRIRVWVNADGFISALNCAALDSFEPGPPAVWHFVAQAGDGRTVEIQISAAMIKGQNATVFHFCRPKESLARGKQLPPQAEVRLTVRFDIEDRSFHAETKRNGAAEHHFANHTHLLETGAGGRSPSKPGFAFTPAPDRQLRVFSDAGWYHPQPEWSQDIPHPVEGNRGQTDRGDAYSPGWFELPLPKGAEVTLVATAERSDPDPIEMICARPEFRTSAPAGVRGDGQVFAARLAAAIQAFLVRRGSGKTVIAGYPWFLDWGRDTFICARGLIAAGLSQEVQELVVTFARFERDGTLPNTVFGEDASNRDTSDAPLWFALVCEELADAGAPNLFERRVDTSGRTLRQVLQSIGTHYRRGTPNGIRMDPASALIWSPSHFTWMDTNYPAGTPRQGYPVEIQALWIRLLRLLGRLSDGSEQEQWKNLERRAQASLEERFWRDDLGYFADVLLAPPGKPAAEAQADDALRSNCLFPISLGLARPEQGRRCVAAVRRHLVVPGALRSLAPLPVRVPLPIHGPDGRLLNNPLEPYWGRYEGDEDTRRKPAYHNGTAWTWTFPVFCEALARAWSFSPDAVAAAKAYLGSMAALLTEGCLGQLPEIVDGDAPHTQRGCDAQAWAATEALRVWILLSSKDAPPPMAQGRS
jgi:predicted glycogen debranching enzyme